MKHHKVSHVEPVIFGKGDLLEATFVCGRTVILTPDKEESFPVGATYTFNSDLVEGECPTCFPPDKGIGVTGETVQKYANREV